MQMAGNTCMHALALIGAFRLPMIGRASKDGASGFRFPATASERKRVELPTASVRQTRLEFASSRTTHIL